MAWTKVFKNKSLIIVLLLAAILRLYKLDYLSLFGDELDVGYHAFSILKTGKDYSGNLLPLQFHSLAEWRTPLYLYTSVPTVALFGISALGVRLPAAIFGVLSIYVFYLLLNKINSKNLKIFNLSLEVWGSLFLAISPWHIQYSRAGFEVTLMLFLLMSGLVIFLNSLENKGKHLWLAVSAFILMPWAYNTAKLFAPLFMILLAIIYRKEIFKFSKNNLAKTAVAGLILGLPLVFNTLYGGGAQRIGVISIFNSDFNEELIGIKRQIDAAANVNPFVTKLVHNKYQYWLGEIKNNLLQSVSSEFLFISGDVNLRHSPNNLGMLYSIEVITLLLGIYFAFKLIKNKKLKLVLISWLLIGLLPSALTIDGGSHATRLILVLPVYIFLIAYGFYGLKKLRIFYLILLALYFFAYQHNFWVHYKIDSGKWWHSGWEEVISFAKAEEANYEKIIISTKGEPPKIFFLGHSEYNPTDWQNKNYNNYSFMHLDSSSIYDWGEKLEENTLYLAPAEEVVVNLVAEPERTPGNLELLKSSTLPSGEPAYYVFTKK